MSSIESLPDFLSSLPGLAYTKDGGAGLIQGNTILRKQRNYLIDRLATEHKNQRATSNMMQVAATTIAQRYNNSLRLADDFNANIKKNQVLLEALGEHAGNSHEGIAKLLSANAEGIVAMIPFRNLRRAVKGKRFVTSQGDDFVADLKDKEMSLYRPASINPKPTSTGVVVADATNSDSPDSDSTDSDSIDSSDDDAEEDSASGSGTDSDDSDSDEEVRPSKNRKAEDVEPGTSVKP